MKSGLREFALTQEYNKRHSEKDPTTIVILQRERNLQILFHEIHLVVENVGNTEKVRETRFIRRT